MTSGNNLSFEKAYERLEVILNKMNSSEVALEESLKLFEEANSLINLCNSKLKGAHQKIETLIKDRQGNLAMSERGEPMRRPFPDHE